MPGQVVDSLVIATEFDERGLDASVTSALSRINRFTAGVEQAARSLPEITLSTDPAQASLAEAQAAFERFIAEARDLKAFPNFTTDDAQREIAELLAAFPGLQGALSRVDPTGVFTAMARDAREAATAIQQAAAAQRQVVRAPVQPAVPKQDVQQLRLLGAVVEEEARLERQLGATAAATDRLSAADTQLAASLTQQGIASARAGAASRIQAEQAARAQAISNQAHRLAAATAQSVEPAVRAVTAGYIAETQAAQRLAQQNLPAARAVDQVAAVMGRATSGANAMAQGMANISAANARIVTGTVAAGKGLDRLRAGLTGLALTASGTSPAVGQLVSGLLLLGGGSVAVLGVAAGAAVLATAFNLLDAPIRKAREETEELLETLNRLRIGRLPQFQQIGLQMDDVREKMLATTQRALTLQATIERLGTGPAGGAFRQGQLERELDLLRQLGAELADLTKLRQQVQLAGGNELVRDLGRQVAAFGLSEQAARRLAVAMDSSLTPSQRAAATAMLDTLEALERQKKRAEEIEKMFERLGFVIPELSLEIIPELKPRVDFSLIDAAISKTQALVDRGFGDDEFKEAEQAAAELANAIHRVGLSLKDIGDAGKLSPEDAIRRMETATDDLLNGLDAVVGAASNIGLIGEEASRGIGSVVALGDAIKNVIASASTGNILGLVGAGLNFLGGALSGGESEHDRIVRENTEAIKRNTAARSEQFGGLGGAQDIALAVQRLLGDQAFKSALQVSRIPGGIGAQGRDEVSRQLEALGLSIGDLQRAAEEFAPGLDILDSKGRLVAGALDQLQAEILADIQAQLRFRQTLDDLVLAGDLRARITGEGLDAKAAFQRLIDAAARDVEQGGLGSTLIADMLGGIDLGDPAAVRTALLGLLDVFESGEIDARTLGNLSREDFLRLLEQGAGFLDAFNQGLVDATAELNIVPRGFRQAALVFQAQDPAVAMREFTDGLANLVIPAAALLPPDLPGDGAALPQIAATLSTSTSALAQIAAALQRPEDEATAQRDLVAVLGRLAEVLGKARVGTTINGDIRLELPSTGGDPREQALDVRRALEDLSMADYGRTDAWGKT